VSRIAIALGSNLGDRRAAIAFAVDRLGAIVSNLTVSDLIETEPEGPGGEDQPLYLNAVAVGDTTMSPRQTLDALLEIEREFGRERPYPGAPRTLDLDLVLFGDHVAHESDLHVPHPRFRERFFVLGPLAQVGADLIDPETGLSVAVLLRNLLRDETR
jgi:2-amino-4-hydroxy-6-hydroxymethyldihydropteridine diphosphokinase